jgi:hypothetical protein
METITETYNIYSFNELSDESKEKAVENLHDINVDYDWWDNVYSDAEQVGIKIEEFGIDRNYFITTSPILSPDDIANAIIKNHGDVCNTYKIASEYLKNSDELDDEFLSDIEDEYLSMLNREYEYLTSEESIIETIEANEYNFLENGELH